MRYRLMRFSCRSLLVVVTLFCLVLGYGANWKWQRRQFLAEEERKAAGLEDQHQYRLWDFEYSNSNVHSSPTHLQTFTSTALRILVNRGMRSLP